MRSTSAVADYDKYGPSNQCFEGKSEAPCRSGSKLCGALTTDANFVYKVNPGK